jgi:hypothetical protein
MVCNSRWHLKRKIPYAFPCLPITIWSGAGIFAGGEGHMDVAGRLFRAGLIIASIASGVLFSTGAVAQAVNFSFRFSGTMSCMQPVPVSGAPISGSGTGVLNQDGSVTAEISQSLLVFSTTQRFDSRLGAGVTSAPGGTAQVRVAGRQSLKFFWNLPNNTLIVTVAVRGQSCSATFQANLLPGKTQYTFFDGSTYHYCGRPVMTSSSCELR